MLVDGGASSRAICGVGAGHISSGARRLDPVLARAWYLRWERQQELYAGDREDRFGAVLDTVEAVRSHPLVIVDLGSGPGSLAVRAARRFPGARVVAVDHDPFLLALGAAVHDGVEFVSAHIGGSGWTRALGPPGCVDAVVSSTALHYPAPTELASIYRDCAGLLADGGVLVDADQLPAADPALRAAMTSLDSRRHMAPPAEDWSRWWSAAAAEPAFRELLPLRAEQTPVHGVDNDLSADDHRRLLADAGFRASAVVWQRGASSVVAAVR